MAAVTVFGFGLPVVLSLGVPVAIGQRAATEPSMRPSLLAAAKRFTCLTIPIAIVAGAIVVSGPLSSIKGGAQVVALVTLGASPLAILGTSLLQLLQAEGALGPLAKLWAVPPLVSAVLTIGLALGGWLTVTTYLTATLISGLPTLIASWCLVREPPSDPYPLRALLSFGVRGFAGSVANMANARLDQMIIVPFVGSAQLGLYAVSVSLASHPLGIAQSIAARSFGQIAHAADRAGEAARYLRLTVLIGVLACTAVAVSAPFGIPLLYGPSFRGSLVPLLLLLPGTVALAIISSSTATLLVLNRPGLSSLAELLGLVITVVGLIVVLGPLGILGAALVSSLSYSCTLAVHIAALRRLGVKRLVPGRAEISWVIGRFAEVMRRRWRIHTNERCTKTSAG